jgi:hypothetical protein
MTTSGLETVCALPNGHMLYRQKNEVGGYRYWSDEIGDGVMVWDTCLITSSTLLAAIIEEERRGYAAYMHAQRAKREAEREAPKRPGFTDDGADQPF